MARITTHLEELVGTITMVHDDRRNALSQQLIAEMMEALDGFTRDGARVVVLRANPGAKVWSAGHDIRELAAGDEPLAYDDPLERVIRAIRGFPAPVIAMVEGSVWGGACELVLCCDIPIAAPSATFALTPAKIGVPYNAAGLLRVMNEVEVSVCKEMFFTARPIPAQRALEVGIVNHLVPAEEIEAFTYEMARHITTLSPLSISVIKEQMVALSDARPLSPDAFERIQSLRRSVYRSRDFSEGVAAFLAKRRPVW
jgi:methylmalonyl-CoA decarboxylase